MSDHIIGIVLTDGEIAAVMVNEGNIKPWAEHCGKTVQPVRHLGPTAIVNLRKSYSESAPSEAILPSELEVYALAVKHLADEAGCNQVLLISGMVEVVNLPLLQQEVKKLGMTVFSVDSCDPI